MNRMKFLDKMAMKIAAGIMRREVNFTEFMKIFLALSLRGSTFEKADKSTVMGAVKTFIRAAKLIATLKLPISVLDTRRAKIMP